MVRAGSPRGRPRCLRGCRAQQRPASPGSPPLPALAAGTRAAPAGPSPRASPGWLPPAPLLSSRLCLVSGIRTEQDFYVRLIDSMTKQVGAADRPSRGVAAVGAAPGGETRPRGGAAVPGGAGTEPPPPAGTAALPLRPPTGLRGGEGVPVGPSLRLGCGRKIQATLQPSQ